MKKSDITIDKAFTTVANVPLCKKCAADFCARYTDGDMVTALTKAAWDAKKPEYIQPNADMMYFSADIYCDRAICPSESDVNLCIRAFLYTWSSVFRVTIYCDMTLEYKADLTDVERFDKVKRD